MPYTLNGQQAHIDEEPHGQQGYVYVPFKKVVSALGGTVTWDNDAKQAAGTIGQWTAVFVMASDTAAVNGATVQFPSPPYDADGEVYVPAEFFHNAYGYKVDVNGTSVSISV